MRKLAPLVIFVYNRSSITQQMLEAINHNTLAPETEVFIYSDGPKNEDDLKKVLEVRKCIHDFAEISNFKTVKIVESDKNKGLANSIIGGVTEVIQRFERVIVLEDDLITAVNFLDFMNDCLDYYKNNKKIWSIGGTTYKMDALDRYPHDVYVCYRGESCGWATWIDRWSRVDWNVTDYEVFMKDKKRKKLFKRGGQDMVEALKKQMEGKTDSWAIRWCYQESKEDMLTVLPSKSLIKNIGWDGSGTHSDVDRFHTEIDSEKYEYKLMNVEINEMLMKDFRKYFSKPFMQRIMDYLYIKIRG